MLFNLQNSIIIDYCFEELRSRGNNSLQAGIKDHHHPSVLIRFYNSCGSSTLHPSLIVSMLTADHEYHGKDFTEDPRG